MPKIEEDDRSPDPALLRRYRTVPSPAVEGTLSYAVRQLRNLQSCACGHDRCCHCDFAGEGDERVMILDCPSAGKCLVRDCDCGGFVFSRQSCPEGKKRRKEEKRIAKVFPPEEPAEKVKETKKPAARVELGKKAATKKL